MAVNGEPVHAGVRESYAAPLSSVVVGKNLIGASPCGFEFTGELLEISYLDPTLAQPPAARLDPLQ